MAPRNRRTDADRREQTTTPAQPFDSFHAGYLRIDEDHLYRTGIRGCKKYVLYCVITFLFIVTMANLIVTVCILGSFRIGYKGAAAFEFIPPAVLWRVFYDVDTDTVAFSEKGILASRRGKSLPIDAYDAAVHINSLSGNTAKISVEPTGTTVTADRLTVMHPRTSKILFSSDKIRNQTLTKPRKIVQVTDLLQVAKLSSKVDGDLRVESEKNIYMTGMEGVNMEGLNITIAGEEAVTFSTTDGSVNVDGASGIAIGTDPTSSGRKTYKVCVCSRSGRVFLSVPGRGCVHSGTEDPCIT